MASEWSAVWVAGVYLSVVGRGRLPVLVTFGVQVTKFTRSRDSGDNC